MKKNLFMLLTFLFMLCINFDFVKAEGCDYAEQARLNNLASTIKAEGSTYSYSKEIFDETYNQMINEITRYGYIGLYNLTDELYAEVKGANETKKYYEKDKSDEGIIYIQTGLASLVKNYTISIYPTDLSCGKSPIRTINVTIPRYNRYFIHPMCDSYPGYYYCSEYLTLEEIDETTFLDGVERYKNNLEKKQQEEEKKQHSIIYQTVNFVNQHKVVFISLAIILIIIIIYFVYKFIKKRKERIV